MRVAAPIFALLILVACGTPQEQCIGAGTRDIRVLDRLIKESEGNLARGYGFQAVTVTQTRWVHCGARPTPEAPNPAPRMCLENYEQTIRKPVSLDLEAEAAKLKGMTAKRADLVKAAQPLIKECKAKYPEE